MSVAVAVAGPEGIVLATDSRTIQQSDGIANHYRVTSDTAEKLFLLRESLAVATYGIAMVGTQTIRGHLDEFEVPDGDVYEVSEALGDFFEERLRAVTPTMRRDLVREIRPRWPLGFIVAGYDSDGVGRILEVKVGPMSSRSDPAALSTTNPGLLPRGQTDAISRLIDGVDWKAVDIQRIDFEPTIREQLEELRYDLIDPATIDDASQLAQFLVETQIRAQRFSDGTVSQPRIVPGCGGPIRVLAVDRGGAHWVQNPGGRSSRLIGGLARSGTSTKSVSVLSGVGGSSRVRLARQLSLSPWRAVILVRECLSCGRFRKVQRTAVFC